MLALLVMLCVSAPSTADANAAFERLGKLEGVWKTDPKEGPVQYVTLRLVAGGAAVLETTSSAEKTSLTGVTVFAFEGTELIAMRHGSGGSARLRLAQVDGASLRFESTLKTARIAGLLLTLNAGKLKQEWSTREAGREAKKGFEMTREYLDVLK